MTNAIKNSFKVTALTSAAMALSACGGSDGVENTNIKPTYLSTVA